MAVVKKRRLKLGWKRVLVSEVDEDLFRDGVSIWGHWGELCPEGEYYIELDSRAPQKRKAEILLHEMNHMIDDYIGGNWKEKEVKAYTNIQSQIFQENPWLKDYIWPEKE